MSHCVAQNAVLRLPPRRIEQVAIVVIVGIGPKSKPIDLGQVSGRGQVLIWREVGIPEYSRGPQVQVEDIDNPMRRARRHWARCDAARRTIYRHTEQAKDIRPYPPSRTLRRRQPGGEV